MRIVALVFGLMFSIVACADEKSSSVAAPLAPYVEGKHYFELAKPVRTITPGKIEVNEVFWYGCIHCYRFEKPLESWKAAMPEQAAFIKTPAVWRANMLVHAQIYYAAKALNVEDKITPAAFKAMLDGRKPLANESQIAGLFVAAGVSQEKFSKTFNSFGVKSQAQQADSRVRSLQVTGTPTLFVDGRYRITTESAGNHDNMLKIASYLVEKIIKEKS